MIARSTPLATLLLVGAALVASAGEEDVLGVWKRPGETDRYYVIEKTDAGLGGRLVNPPFATMSCSLELELVENELRGVCHWTEESEGKTYTADTKWEFKIGEALTGRAEAMDWEGGVVYHREWVAYTLERVARTGLVTEGEAGEAGFGEELGELANLAGGYTGPGGAWAASVEGEELVLTPVGHHEGTTVRLKNERDTLRGEAKLADGSVSKLELGFNEGALAGRSSWNAGPVEGWSPLSFARLERTEASEGDASAPTAGEGPIAGVWKRADGLYLRVRTDAAGATTGVLSDAAGAVKARLTLGEREGVWKGTVNWGDYETKLELAVAGDELKGRGQWADLSEGKLVATGWSGRSYKRLKRLN